MEDGTLESFYYKYTFEGIEHDYRITMDEDVYHVEYDGLKIADLQHNEKMVLVQISGLTLDQHLIEAIGDKIEDYWD